MTGRRRRRGRTGWSPAALLALALITLALLAAGCGSAAGGSAGTAGPSAAAGTAGSALAPCPASTAGGGALPAVTLPCLGRGPDVRLAGLRGPALVNVWASWCQPCLKEAPDVQRLHARAGRRLLVLGVVTEDDRGQALAAARGMHLTYPSVFDRDGALRRHYGIPGPPFSLFVDARGRVVHEVIGALPTSPAALDALVARYLSVRIG